MAKPTDIVIVTKTDGSSPTVRRNIFSIWKLQPRMQMLCWDRLNRNAKELNRKLPVETIVSLKGFGLGGKIRALGLVFWWLRITARLLFHPWKLAFAHDFEAASAVWLVSRLLRRPYIYHIHDNFTLAHNLSPRLHRLFDAMDERFIRDAFAIIVPDSSRILSYAQPFASKFLVLPNTFALGTNVPAAASVSARPFTVLALGSLTRDRGIDILMEAGRSTPGTRLLIAGHCADVELRQAIESADFVDYRGHLEPEAALRLYGETDIVFMFYKPNLPLNVRAAPMKLGEALMLGRPVLINSEVFSSEHIVRDWGAGASCAYDAEALTRELARLRGIPQELEAMGRRARQVFESEFAWDFFEPALIDAVSRALGEPRAEGVAVAH